MKKGDKSAYTEIQKRVNGEGKRGMRKRPPMRNAWVKVNRLKGVEKRRIEVSDGSPECLILQFGQVCSQR